MLKLLDGIVVFHETLSANAQSALCQSPDAAFIGCSDSRVDPRIFASKEPGDVFVHRNVGNLVPPCRADGTSGWGNAVWAFIEYALLQLKVEHLVVCGHSECGAMLSIFNETRLPEALNLQSWLEHGRSAFEKLRTKSSGELRFGDNLSEHNKLSQLSVLEQMDHLRSHPVVRRQLESGALQLHGWWFEIATASVYDHDEERGQFAVIDRAQAERIKARIARKKP